MNNTPTLIAYSGPHDGARYPLREGTMMLGTHLASDIQVEWDATVSRRHARIEGVAGLFWLVDLESKNGSLLLREDGSEERLQANQPTLLVDGKWLRLGKYAFFQVVGLVKSNQMALEKVYRRYLKQFKMLEEGLSMPNLAPDLRLKQGELIAEYREKLSKLSNKAEFLRFVANGIPTIGVIQELIDTPDAAENDEPLGEDELPAWENHDDLLYQDRIPTLRNIFIDILDSSVSSIMLNKSDHQGDQS